MERIEFRHTKLERFHAAITPFGYSPSLTQFTLISAPVWGTYGLFNNVYTPSIYNQILAGVCWFATSFVAGAIAYAYRWDPRFRGVTTVSFDSGGIDVCANGTTQRLETLNIFHDQKAVYLIAAPGQHPILIPKRAFANAVQKELFCGIARGLWLQHRRSATTHVAH